MVFQLLTFTAKAGYAPLRKSSILRYECSSPFTLVTPVAIRDPARPMDASGRLIKVLGGGWSETDLPKKATLH